MKLLVMLIVLGFIGVAPAYASDDSSETTVAAEESSDKKSKRKKKKSRVKKEAKRLASKEQGSPKICSRVKARTGSRLSRIRCRTKEQIERDAAAKNAMLGRDTDRFKRAERCYGCSRTN